MGKTNNRVVKLLLLYTLLLVLTSFIRSFESDNILINSSSFLLVFAIYIICIYTWSMSVWRRIIHTHVRTYLMRICGLMMFWVLIRTFRFASFNQIELINRYLRYSYSIILILIPLFSFFAALCIGKPENCRLERKFNLLYIPAIALMVGVMSNDFHQLAFKFPSGLGFWTENTIYERGIIFYLIVIWALGLFLGVVLILFKKSYTPFTKNQLWMPLIFIIVGIIYTALHLNDSFHSAFGFMEMTAMYSILVIGIWESCIQSGLLKSNTEYERFFNALDLGAQIMDENGQVYYHSNSSKSIDSNIFDQLMRDGLYTENKDTILHCQPIQAGYVIWKEDVSYLSSIIQELQRLENELMDSVQILKEDLRIKQRRLRLDEHNRMYNLTIQQVMPQIEKIKDAIASANSADDKEKSKLLRKINVLGTYIKRRTHLALMREEKETVTVNDFTRCFNEYTEILNTAGIKSSTKIDIMCQILPGNAIELYDFFEQVIELVLFDLKKLHLEIISEDGKFLMKLIIKLKQKSTVTIENLSQNLSIPVNSSIYYESNRDKLIQITLHLEIGCEEL